MYLFDVNFSTSDGSTYGYWMFGHVVYWSVVFLASLKIFTFAFSYSFLFIFMMAGSLGLFGATWMWVSTFDVGELEHTFGM